MPLLQNLCLSKASRISLLSLIFALLLLSLGGMPTQAQGPNPPILARLPFASRAELERLVDTYDVWEVDYQTGYALAALTQEQVDDLKKASLPFTIDPTDAATKLMDDYPACYAGVDGLYNQMNQLAAEHPGLATLEDFGASWLRLHPDSRGNGDRLQALVLGNRARLQNGPTFFLMANIHARELATPETALAFTRGLLQGYGTDPDATWLLDTQRTVVILTANPDGHRVAEQGYLQRKNANNTVGNCPNPPNGTFQYGVDLNRNHSLHWGEIGSTTSPCTQTYRGTGPASEVETQAIQEYASALISSRRSNDTTPVSLDTPNLLVSLHSYGRWVLWPWGYTQQPAPEAQRLQVLGNRFAGYNGYTAGQSSITLYDTSGDTTDWAYGALGISAYTFEIGTVFFQPCADLPGIIDANVPALRYAARVARAPYQLPLGPDLTQVTPDLGSVNANTMLTISLTADASRTPAGLVGGVEVKVGTADWTPGTGTPLMATDGVFDEAIEPVQGSLSTGGLTPGRHLVYARGRTNDGTWGPVWAMWLTITGAANANLGGQIIGSSGGIANARVVVAPGGATTLTGADGSFNLSVPQGAYQVKVFAAGYDSTQRSVTVPGSTQLITMSKLPCVLLVDADPSGVALSSWVSTLSGIGQPFRTWRVTQDGSPRLNTLREYGIVIWIGGQNGALSEAQQGTIQGYLEAGGHLLLSGQKLALGQPPAPTFYSNDLTKLQSRNLMIAQSTEPGYFFTHDLHLRSPQTQTANDISGADFLSGLSLNLTGSDRIPYSQQPTAMTANLGGAAVLRYGLQSSTAAVAFADETRRLVVFGFGLETVNGPGNRQALLSRTLRWLGCPGDCSLMGDVNRDGQVNTGDAQLVAAGWLRSSGSADYVRHHDLDGSGRIDVIDITLITRAWGQVCSPS